MRHLIVLFSLLLFTGCVAETPSDLSDGNLVDDARRIYAAAERWFLQNLREDGSFHYAYFPKTDEYPKDNNAIRQLMAARLLGELASEHADLLPLHQRNLQYYLTHWYRVEGDLGYVLFDDKSKLGANAMLLRTLVWSPYFEEHIEEARRLADGILSLMDERGAFRAWFKEPDYSYDEAYLLTFYSGEALLALAEYAQETSDRKYLNAAIKGQDFYVEQYVKQMNSNYYPAYVPWHTMSLHLLWEITGKEEYADAAFALNDKLLELLDRTDHIGRFYNPATPQYGTPHASSDGVYSEGIAHAYEMAKRTGDIAHQNRYEETLRLALRNLRSLQYTEASAATFKYPDRTVGAIRSRADQTGIRIDTVQHSMDALRKILDVFDRAQSSASGN